MMYCKPFPVKDVNGQSYLVVSDGEIIDDNGVEYVMYLNTKTGQPMVMKRSEFWSIDNNYGDMVPKFIRV